MDNLLMVILGYIIHDAVQPTVVGKVLDKVSLPKDLLSTDETADETSNTGGN